MTKITGVGSAFYISLILAVLVMPAQAVPAGRDAVDLPAGWQLRGNELVWTSDKPLHTGDARFEFRSGTRLLGYPEQRGNRLRLRLSPGDAPGDLSVWAAGRRLDVTDLQPRTVPAAPPAEAPIAVFEEGVVRSGPHATRRLQYRLTGLDIPDFPADVEVLAEVTAPLADIGPMPLVLFLHGRHNTCYRGGPDGEISLEWPCPAGWSPIPSHSGYRYITDLLASRGYLTVSISANGINAQDGLFFSDGGAFARSLLVRHHLAQWAAWNDKGGDPWGGRFRGRVKLNKVVLVGHSRGGEGVERATIDTHARDPWKIQGLVLIGPTAFGRQVAAGVHTTVILPFCDGDVSDLQGQQYVDIGRDLTRDRALRSSVMAMGTNHNFYNTEWTPGLAKSAAWDDWFDPTDRQCGEQQQQRLTPQEQQAVGLAYTAALVLLAVEDDRRMVPLLDGTRVKPRSIGRASAFVHAIGGGKRVLYAPGTGTPVRARSLSVRECRGYYYAGLFDLRPGCTPNLWFDLLPHWLFMGSAETAPAPRALDVRWQAPGGSLRIPIATAASDTLSFDLRMAGKPGAPPVRLDVYARTASGLRIRIGEHPLELNAYEGPSPLGKVVARQLRAKLEGRGIDPARITELELVPRTPDGRFWLLDVSSRQGRLPASDQIHLPRISVSDVIVAEGDEGEFTVDVPIRIDGAVKERARVWVQLTDYADFENPVRGFPLVLEPGATSASFPFTYVADDIYTPFPRNTQVVLLAQKNAVTADFDGTILVEEDDPPPVLSVDANRVTATEGATLTWTFRLSEPMAFDAFWSIEFRSPAGRFPELDSDDVPRSWLKAMGFTPPEIPVPLSQLGIWLYIEFAPGELVATVSIPIARDGAAEEREGVMLVLDGFGDPVVPKPIDLTGVVPAQR